MCVLNWGLGLSVNSRWPGGVGYLPAFIFKLVSPDSHLSPVEKKIVCRGQGDCHHWCSVRQKNSSSVYLGNWVRPQNRNQERIGAGNSPSSSAVFCILKCSVPWGTDRDLGGISKVGRDTPSNGFKSRKPYLPSLRQKWKRQMFMWT